MPLENPFRKSMQITWLCLALSGILPLFAQLAGADPVLVWILGGVGALICLILLPILATIGRRYLREMQALIAGEYLAHWQLDPAEWQRFTEADWARGRRGAVTMPLWIGGVGLGLAALIGAVAGTFDMVLVWVAGGSVLVAALLGLLLYGTARSTYQKRLTVPGEVYIGTKGVLNGTAYTSWVGFGISLTGVAIEESSPMAIRFTITANSGESSSTSEVRVPVPLGREEEAVNLVARFHGAG